VISPISGRPAQIARPAHQEQPAFMQHSDGKQDPFEFPCEFPIKVFGRNDQDFDAVAVGIVRRHVEDLKEGAVRTTESRNGRYLSVTITIEAASREQLDDIYRDLTDSEHVIMAL
jgi:putative lipoic acid-binding regulatory protein